MSLAHHRGGAGEPLVLVHGTGSQWQAFGPVLELLEAHRDVIALDLPGFGDSPPLPPATPHVPAAFAERPRPRAAARDAARRPTGLRPRAVLRRSGAGRARAAGRKRRRLS